MLIDGIPTDACEVGGGPVQLDTIVINLAQQVTQENVPYGGNDTRGTKSKRSAVMTPEGTACTPRPAPVLADDDSPISFLPLQRRKRHGGIRLMSRTNTPVASWLL